MFKRTLFLLTLIFAGQQLSAWGPIGHRVIGQIATNHLDPKAKKAVDEILDGESLAMVSTWMDFVRSDPSYDSLSVWHYSTIPNGMVYSEPEDRSDGLLIEKLQELTSQLKSGEFERDEEFALKCLVHLLGDLHQPLHVGTGTDRGGNSVRVRWFGERTNLHRVWDIHIIDQQELSYSEYARYLDRIDAKEKIEWSNGTILDWANENKEFRESIYDLPEDNSLGYDYIFQNLHIMELQMQKAGIRLASILNEVYG